MALNRRTPPAMDYQSRQKKLQADLAPNRLDALLVSHLPNIRYLCGFTGSSAALLLSENGGVFFSDGRYTTQARQEVQAARVVIARKAPLLAAAEWLKARPGRVRGRGRCRLGIEAQHLSVEAYGRLVLTLGPGFRLRPAPAMVEAARAVKDPQEIASLCAAAALGAGLFDRLLAVLAPGVTETAAAAELEYAARTAGAEGMSFPTIVVSGERSALPHGRPGNQPIGSNGFVVCDFGVILAGYCSDMTRTMYVGRPTSEARRVYQAVLEAQQAALNAIRPGTIVGEVDRAARKVLQKEGLSKYFTHSTGHGVGLEIHEAPRVAAGQTEVLRPGMVLTVEPGVYIPGKWGLRIEDMVVVTEQECEVLTHTGKDHLIAL
jgi:Xaa-Pro aminopeptidase